MKLCRILLACLVMAAALAGCGTPPASSSPAASSQSSSPSSSVPASSPASSSTPARIPREKSALYEAPDLGLSIQFPENWAGNYSVIPYPISEGDSESTRLEFVFRSDYAAPLLSITVAANGQYQNSGDATLLGKNSRYEFIATSGGENPYQSTDEASSELFQSMVLEPAQLAECVTISEP